MEPYVKDGILYRVIKTKEEIISFLKLEIVVFFKDVPALREKQHIAPSTYKDYNKSAQNILDDSIVIGAFDQETERMTGGILIEDKFGGSEGGDPYEEFHSIFYPSIDIMLHAAQELLDDGVITKEKGKYLHLYLMVVHPDFRGRGIAKELTRLHEEIGKERMYEYSYIELFSKEYQNLCLGKGGYTGIKSIPFLEFEKDGVKVFEDTKPHLRPGEENLAMIIAIKKL